MPGIVIHLLIVFACTTIMLRPDRRVSGTGSLTATRNAAEFICGCFNVLIHRLFEPRIAMRHRMGTSSLAARLTFSARNLLLAFALMRAAL